MGKPLSFSKELISLIIYFDLLQLVDFTHNQMRLMLF